MKRGLFYLAVGALFGITMFKSEAASWFRIYEMFQFKSFHMYGIIGSALFLGVIIMQLINRGKIKTFDGEQIVVPPKDMSVPRYLIGGLFFGLGWALAGACPGPMFTLTGAGYWPILVVIGGALIGTWVYGLLRSKLPH
ncbi:YeeE/YedE family protein [Robertkochia sediminum]|uniref:YeeE/YedE family protein n=1 Tax=Robertkochia sediminum TaxID=2785326 RepID=UPI001931A14A|nr:DUF6691 family protein [Robertkochia sediminum]MBL7473182.1 YeeE/YedE family protein [Robertkochia sediminum]